MSEPIRVDLARECDLSELRSYLMTRGHTASRIEAEGDVALEVTSPSREIGETEVWDALAAWLESSDRPLVPRVVADREFALTPPGE